MNGHSIATVVAEADLFVGMAVVVKVTEPTTPPTAEPSRALLMAT